MVVAQIREGIDIEVCCRVDGGIEHKAKATVPVTVNVLRTGDGSTGRLHISSLVRHGVAGRREVHERHHGTLVIRKVIVVEEVDVLRERRLQTRVTTSDAQGVAVIIHIQQVAHGRLLGIGTVGQTQLTGLRLLPTEVHCRREVSHGTGSICTQTCCLAIHQLRIVLDEV